MDNGDWSLNYFDRYLFQYATWFAGAIKKAEKLTDWQSKDARINILSLARLFLFGARDVWFVVGLPIYFQSVFSDGTPEGNREAFFLVGSFMAIWIIGYGFVQSLAPRLIGSKIKAYLW